VEEQLGGGVVLHELAVHPGADAQGGGVDIRCRDDGGADGGESVAAFGAQVGALVCVAQVVDAEVIGGGYPGDVGPTVLRGYTAGARADDECDLSFEGKQLASGGSFDRSAGGE